MADANSNIQLSGLDFDQIKVNLRTFLQSQDTFKDYNFEGSGLSVLLDILAYNTQYNAFYLNMTANEMFLDTALQRSSVVSHAKLLNYIPNSAVAPSAYVNLYVSGVTLPSLTLPAFTSFVSEPVGDTNYNFVVDTTTTAQSNTANGLCIFENVRLRQGIPTTYTFTVDSTSNPTYTYSLPDSAIDISTIIVNVQKSSSNTSFEVFKRSENYLVLDGNSPVYFLQESLNGNYEIYFGDGILGKKLTDGNIISVSYIITQGTASDGANNFVLSDSVPGFTNTTVFGVTPAAGGRDRESIESIKFQAPKSYSAQNRAVTNNDYITILTQNQDGVSFDAVNVWGGEENDPPVYGQVFVCLKPAGGYKTTQTQKLKIINDILKPVSMVTVQPVVVDPDYTFIKVTNTTYFDQSKTNLSSNEIENAVKIAIYNFANQTLNSFNTTFSVTDLLLSIKSISPSIITNEIDLKVQKKLAPNLTTPTTYKLLYGVSLQRGALVSGISSYPAMSYLDPLTRTKIYDNVFIEEVPKLSAGIDSVSILNTGYNYQKNPTITIVGDGTGANVSATIDASGKIQSITVLNAGNNYTSAIAVVSPATDDTTGQGGQLSVNLQGRYGQLRLYYYDTVKNLKTVVVDNIGTVDYELGTITLENFSPLDVDNDFEVLTITSTPTTTIINSSYNRLLSIDPDDPLAVSVKAVQKSKS